MNNKVKLVIDNYVFNNPIKLIFNKEVGNEIHNLDLSNLAAISTKPFKYSIRLNNKCRSIHFPNYINYYIVANKIIVKLCEFQKNKFNRLKIDFDNRKLLPNHYRKCFQKDKNDLKFKYENLSFFDISNFYNSIYTHCFEHIGNNNEFKFIDENLRKLNNNKTKGILLGSLLSVACANRIMDYLCGEISVKLGNANICHNISFFSDQIYIKHNYNDTKLVYDFVRTTLEKDYFEFKLSEQKYRVFTYADLLKDNIFEHNINKLREIFYTSIDKGSRSTKLKDELRLVQHLLNTIIDQLINSSLDVNVHETYLRVALKSIFSSPVHLHMLHNAICIAEQVEINEIINNVLYLISHYPVIIYDMFQLSIFDAINIKEWISADDMNVLYKKLTSHNINDYEFLYWFFKIIVLQDRLKKHYEIISFKNTDSCNRVLIAFLIRNAPNLLNDDIKNDLSKLLVDIKNLTNENWLICYEYMLHLKSIQENYRVFNNANHGRLDQMVQIINDLLDKNISFICNGEQLLAINEVSKTERWQYDDIPNIPKILRDNCKFQ